MASVYKYLCKTCNTDLGSDANLVESHLVSNPTHSIRELLYDGGRLVSNIEGQTRIYNSRVFSYDESRSKWLSLDRFKVTYALPATNQRNVYMRLWGVMTPISNAMGFRMPYNVTLTKMTATCSAVSTDSSTMNLRVYGGSDYIYAWMEASDTMVEYLDVNTDINAGVNLSCYLVGTGRRSNAQLVTEFAWRI